VTGALVVIDYAFPTGRLVCGADDLVDESNHVDEGGSTIRVATKFARPVGKVV
jgi:hypothetical protein